MVVLVRYIKTHLSWVCFLFAMAWSRGTASLLAASAQGKLSIIGGPRKIAPAGEVKRVAASPHPAVRFDAELGASAISGG